MKRATLTTLVILCAALLGTACSGGRPAAPAELPSGTYKVDALFWDFYTSRGGQEIFGPAITSIFTYQGQKMQYLESGLMVYSPELGESGFSFASLGLDLNLIQQPSPVENPEDGVYVGGYFVPTAFLKSYQSLGSDIVGAPLSNPIPNLAHNRVEQHFTNLGFYYRMDDPGREVRLLQYGLAVCGSSCRMEPDAQSAVADVPIISAYFVAEMQRIGGDVTGNPITAPFTANDGREEVIFENQVFSAENSQVIRRTLPELVGFPSTAPVAAIPDARLFFIPTNDQLGHNVLAVFHNWILDHNGYEATGMPTTEVFAVDNQPGLIRQCFHYMCLDYDANSEEISVRPVALGQEYRLRFYPAVQPGANPLAEDLTPGQPRANPQTSWDIQTWDRYPLIRADQQQTIIILVIQDGAAAAGVAPVLYFSIDGGPTQSLQFPATDSSGLAEVTMAPVAAGNSSLVSFRVCLPLPSGGEVCAEDSFLVWMGS